MFYNIRFPIRFINCVLQGKGQKAGDEFATFFLNTTVGFLGFANVASYYDGLPPSPEDTGLSLEAAGHDHGFFLTLPILGPSSGRDFIGMIGDYVMDPLTWLLDFRTGLIVFAGESVNATSLRIGDYEALIEAALDPYIAIRDAWVQHRAKLAAE
jgi:phospholipid-binding lipoprotein MlaA